MKLEQELEGGRESGMYREGMTSDIDRLIREEEGIGGELDLGMGRGGRVGSIGLESEYSSCGSSQRSGGRGSADFPEFLFDE